VRAGLTVLFAVAGATALGRAEGTAWAGTLLPERGGSPNADRIASLYAVVLVLAALVLAGVTAALIYALIRYRERDGLVAVQVRGHTRLEIAWTGAASACVAFLAVFTLTKLNAIEDPDRTPASHAAAVTAGVTRGGAEELQIDVIGRQYIWMFKYPNGAHSYTELVAPVGVTVRLDIVSVDVAHSWWIPKLGGKLDAVPGYVNHTWFRLHRAGVYTGQCAELCGRNHADMTASVRGVAPTYYARWVDRQKREIDVANARAARQGVP
jgi:cytochrome c oxidase subunit 2